MHARYIFQSLDVCQDWEWQCESGQCISKSERCDRITHCSDGTDELDCPTILPEIRCNNLTEFSCRYGNPKCVSLQRRCDSVNDCQDSSDEQVAK